MCACGDICCLSDVTHAEGRGKKPLSAADKRSEQIWWCATDRKVGGSVRDREPLRCLTWCRFNKDWQQRASRVFFWEAAIKLLKAPQGHLGEHAHHISIIGGRISDDGSWICGGSSRLTMRAPGMRRQNARINNEPMSARTGIHSTCGQQQYWGWGSEKIRVAGRTGENFGGIGHRAA